MQTLWLVWFATFWHTDVVEIKLCYDSPTVHVVDVLTEDSPFSPFLLSLTIGFVGILEWPEK